MPLPFRLLAVDIDGTLLNSEFKISARDLAALQHVHSLGIEVVVCTGRRHTFAMPIVRQLGFDLWLCSSNGAITRSTRGENFHSDLLPAAVAEEVVRHMAAFRDGTVITFDMEERGALVFEESKEIYKHAPMWVEKNQPYIERVVPLEDCLRRGRDPIQAMICGSVDRINVAEALLTECSARRLIHRMKTEYADRNFSMFDIVNAGCSKGHALERLSAARKIPAAEVMAIGDNYNDLEMLEFAGLPVVMANSSTGMFDRGWHMTRSNNESGVASAIEHFLGASLPVAPAV